ncbi:MAG: hypothetical protein MI922_26835 [Bacteroidales bacterium]|nr:hypothetical protein [Bacteroidales bacterium]
MKKTAANMEEENVKIVHNIDYVNLQDFGYEKAGNVKGDPEIYAAYLQRIINGDLVEENYKGISDEEKTEKRSKLKDLDKEYAEIKKTNESVQKEIKVKETKIEERREELLNIRERHDKDEEALKRETFSPFKFGVNIFILIALTGYLFVFYVSAAYKALYTDLEKIANNIAEGIGVGSIMPQAYELSEAMRYNFLLFLVPFVFYAFGWAFHILLELKHKLRLVFLGALIAVTFAVDFLLALIIHNNVETAKEMVGFDTIPWAQSSTFWVILCLGFLVYIIWSILLDSMFREWMKRNITLNIKKIIKHMRNDIKVLEKKLIPQEPIEQQIAFIREDIDTIVHGNIKAYIDQFTTGWISYLAPQNLKEVKTKIMNIKKDFEEKHQIKSGLIKVVKRKG